MTPVWIFPAYPLLVIGPHAGTLANKLNGLQCLDIIIGGFVFQGIGFMVSCSVSSISQHTVVDVSQVSFMIYAAFIYRLMTQKLPKESRWESSPRFDGSITDAKRRSPARHVY